MKIRPISYNYSIIRYLPYRIVFSLMVFVLLHTIPNTVFCQANRVIDSLNSILDTTQNEKSKLFILNKISSNYVRINLHIADSINKICIEAIESIGDSRIKGDVTYTLFKIQKKSGQYEQALNSIRKAEQLYLDCNDSLTYADCLIDEGSTLVLREDMLKAISVLSIAEGIYLRHKKKDSNLALLYSNLGSINNFQKNYRNAIFFHEKSLALNSESGFMVGVSSNYLNLGSVYQSIKDYDKAIEFTYKALELKENLNDMIGIQRCLNNLGVEYMNKGEVTKAIEFHQKALDYAIRIKSDYDVARSYINLAYSYQKSGLFDKSIDFCQRGYEIANRDKNLTLIKEASRVLSECYASKKSYDEAYKHLLLFKLYSDSIAKENNSKDLNELQIKFETVTKDNEINTLKVDAATQKLKLERVRVYVVLFIGLFVIVAVLVVFLWQRSKNAKKIQAKLQEINDIKTAFFANLSHEFRTPLTLMLGPAEKLLEKAGPEDIPLLQLIHRNASRLLDLDEQLLEFTRIDSGNQKLKLVKGDIVLLISGIATSFQLAAQKKHISFEQNYPSDLPEVLFDPDIIEKVIGNLISNAIKYTPSGGRVEIIVALEESENVLPDKQAHNGSNRKIMIGVNDNGAGIPNEKQKLIFERFYQLNNYSSGIYDGYGIGLALVKELVNLHKGEVVLKSTVGIGSNFSVYIPYVQDTYSKEELKHISRYVNNLNSVEDSVVIDEQKIGSEISDGVLREDNQQIKSNKLLIVDDNQDMRTYLIELLRESYEILEASDGKEGLSLAIQQMPDLIVTDIMMDTMDGIEFCKQLKSNSQTRHIPVIMLTALAELDDKVLGLENGADDYIVKPFVAKELMARIRNLIIQRLLLKDLFTKELRLEPTAVSISSADAVFIQKLIGIIEKNIDNPDLDIAFFASAIGISRSQLHRKVIALTGQAATNFIRIIRIRRAAQLMSQKTGNISEIMYSVGFNNPSYFSKCFKEIYNMTPTDFMNN